MRSIPFVAALALTVAAQAQVPNRLGYQGRLLRGDGSPEAGVVAMTFTLYDAAAAGSPLGCDAAQVALSDGLYSVLLGDLGNCPGAPPAIQASAFDGRDLYLELTVAGFALSPRQRIGTVPYAHRAGASVNVRGGTVEATSVTVGGATGVSISGSGIALGATTVVDGAGKATVAVGTGLTGNGSTASPVAVAADGVTSTLLASDGTSLAKVSGGIMATAAGNVGIGTTSPATRLDVFTPTTNAYAARLVNTSTGGEGHGLRVETNHPAGVLFAAANQGLERVVITNSGNVGIGTISPPQTLTVGQWTAGDNTDYSVYVRRHGTGAAPGTYTSSGIAALNVSDVSGDGPGTVDTIGVAYIGVPRIADGDANAHNATVLQVANDNGSGLRVDGRRNVFVGYHTTTNSTLNRSLMVQDRLGVNTPKCLSG